MILEIKNLRVEFPTRRETLVAVDDVSLAIAPGEVLGMVGESGAGKTLTGLAVIGRHPFAVMLRHVLPNVMGPVLVIATIHIATAIITEATLSFLGVGVPPTQPSLGTLIRIGNDFLFSGEWWITVFPGVALVILVLSVNLLGDWLRDALNPRLR